MFECTIDPERGIACVRPDGPLAADDFRTLATEIDPHIEKEGSLHGLVVIASGFPGWADFAGFVSHLKFVRAHHARIQRVAFVSDDDLFGVLPRVATHFVAAEVRAFPASDLARAEHWAATGQESPAA